jgi:hypothetical protein
MNPKVQEINSLALIPGITAIKGLEFSNTSHLPAHQLEKMQPYTASRLNNLVNHQLYHWLCHSEFSWFLAEALPVAHGLFIKNELDFVVSFEGSEPFFFFLSEEKFKIAQGTEIGTLGGSAPYLNKRIYEKDYKSFSPYWIPPPIKSFYNNKVNLNFTKPLIVINNKLTDEWSNEPINCFYREELELLLKKLDDRYAIAYIRATGNEKGYCNDGSKIKIENDFKTIKNNCSQSIIAQELMEMTNLPFNFAQCLLHAQADLHISCAGGNAILGSYFGGKNIIIGRGEYFEQRQIWHEDSWLKNLSNAKIFSINLKNPWVENLVEKLES